MSDNISVSAVFLNFISLRLEEDKWRYGMISEDKMAGEEKTRKSWLHGSFCSSVSQWIQEKEN